MRPRILIHGALAFAAATCLLTLFWLLLPSAGQASPMSEVPTSVSLLKPSPPPTPDLRWLALIRAQQPHPLAAPQIASPSINVHLTDGFVAGRVAIAATVALSVTRAGSQVAHATVAPVPIDDGFFYLAYPYWSSNSYAVGGGGGYYGVFLTGDVVWVSQAGTVVSMTVPALSALAATSSDTVYGTAPISEPVTVYLFPFATPEVSYTRTVTTDGAGNYQADFAPTDLRPHDSGYVAYAEASDRRAYIRFVAPLLRVRVNAWEMSGFAAPRSTVLITATDAQGTPWYWLNAYASTDGSFWIPSFEWTRLLQPGDHVTATAGGQSFSTTVLTITAHADLISGQVWGEAPSSQSVEVMRFVGPLQSGYDSIQLDLPAEQTTTTATLNGHYTASLPLAPADYGAAVVTGPDGQQTFTRFNVPYLWVHVGEDDATWPYDYYAVWGQVDDFAVPITVAIQGPSGYLKDLRHITAAGNGYFLDGLYHQDYPALDSGDIVTVTTPHGVQTTLVLPVLTAQAEPISDTVFGLAPPGMRLTISVYGWSPQPPPFPTPTPTPPHTNLGTGGGPGPSPFTLVVTATVQGEYIADFSGLVDITNQSSGHVQWTTPEGHTVVRGFRATQRCLPRLEYIQVGGNHLSGWSDYGCPSIALRLRDASGRIKAQQWIYYQGYFYFYLYDGSRPVPILPDDIVELEPGGQVTFPVMTPTPPYAIAAPSEGQVITTSVPVLTVLLDAVANTIAGQAPPGTVLSLGVYHEYGFRHWLTTTVSAQGTYSVSLDDLYTLAAGDQVRAGLSLAGVSFCAEEVIPLLKASLYERPALQGWLSPLTPYTISLSSPRLITAEVSGYAGTEGEFRAWLVSLMPGDTVVVTTPQRVLSLTLPLLSAHIDRATATVSGLAPPNARLQVDISALYAPAFASQVVTATASGVYTASFPNMAPLRSAHGTLTYFAQNGQVRLDFGTPHWQITLGDPCVRGEGQVGGVPITVTLQAGDGTPKGTVTTTADAGSTWFYLCFTTSVQPSDRLALVYPGGLMTFTVPNFTAEHDYARQVLEGHAQPGSAIAATVPVGPYYWGQVIRHAQADATGHYGLDTSDLSLPLNRSGYVVMTDEAGNTVQRNFTIHGYRSFLPFLARTQ